MIRSAASLAAFAALILAQAASAAELPSHRDSPPAKHAAQPSCEIAGEPGVALGNGGCLRISGYVTVGVTAGTLKSH